MNGDTMNYIASIIETFGLHEEHDIHTRGLVQKLDGVFMIMNMLSLLGLAIVILLATREIMVKVVLLKSLIVTTRQYTKPGQEGEYTKP